MTSARASSLTVQALLLSALIGASQITWGALAPILPLYASEFGTSVALLGPALAAFALGRAIMGIPAGILMRWWRPRPYLYVCVTGLIVATALTALVATPTQLVAARLIAGLFAGATITIAFAVLIAGAPADKRGSVMATATVVQLSAGAIGSLLGGWVADTWGLRWVFLAVIIPVIAVIVWDQISPARHYWEAADARSPQRDAVTPVEARSGAPSEMPAEADVAPLAASSKPSRTTPSKPMRKASGTTTSVAWLITVLAFVSFSAFYARFAGEQGLIPTLAYTVAEVSPTALGGMLALGTALSIAALAPISRAVNRGARLSVFLPATIMTAATVMIFPLADEAWAFAALVAAYSVSSAIAGMVPGVVTADRVPRHLTGTAVGVTRTAGDVGAVIGPLAVFALYDQATVWWALASIAAVLIVAALLFIPVARRRSEPPIAAPEAPVDTTIPEAVRTPATAS
ncbi:MFS transporter [Demequina sediminicola]|uniref:MFS transporter n=1 Tax=Demequina sediminicola TaxID=1095026 RepID=UPI000783871C|nr:MFS transporter [Demequina sediminicola]